MTRITTKRVLLCAAPLLALALAGGAVTAAARGTAAHEPTSTTTHTVVVGWGDRGGAANIFSPATLDIYAGDTVTWRVGGALEPHTVTFGPAALLDKLVATGGGFRRVAQRHGPPLVEFDPALYTQSPTTRYDGGGFVTSGLLTPKGSPTWRPYSLTFTTPGTYRYVCMVHYVPGHPAQSMSGVVVVHPRPRAVGSYRVQVGSGTIRDASDAFFPQRLTIHVGDHVTWFPHGFHDVAFGPEAQRDALERQLLVPVAQPSGPPALALNPKIFYPRGGHSYDGTGFVASGILVGPQARPYTLTFTKPGTYEYDCLVHPGMEGVITVLPTAS